MLVAVKTPLIDFRIEGTIPDDLLNYVRTHYPSLEITEDEKEEYEDVFESDWYREQKKNWHPGKSVYVYRDHVRWTQSQLGEKLGGLSKQYISDIEKGRRPISKKLALKLSELFDLPLERFLK